MAWAFHDGGYELRFNRDEKWSRPASADPALETDHPVPGACARDTAAGGTWLFTNEHGLTLAVMNAYPDGRISIAGHRSRGNIPFAAASAKSTDDAQSILKTYGCADFAPFEAILIAEGQVRRYGWDGETFRPLALPPRNFLTSSSVEGASVIRARNARFDALSSSSWHAILDDAFSGGNPAAAIHVTREDGGTVSRTSVTVTTAEIRFSVRRRGGSLQEILFPRKA